ncbi:putative siderophore biosynthesis protein-like protein [Emericellopsis cladophorae]|uniref:Siderophore biosynthesis protein-like protein n=1 Tax=Emericellopsis cladophorae TaxID=2686198 RepID=A0A9P9XVQ1_9HYPO|nr:putative siderophore biosynthesis protein-like protein [Emericellopsis cladophorae]KAI6778493.1 putative siderophore biosynthesis protein-like protein [Emericellopsis cladophorae]
MSLVARVFYGLPDVRAFLSNKTSSAKLRLMQFFGLDITLFGGPSQPEPDDERGGIKAAERMAKQSDKVINPNQYENDNNWKSHVRWTGPQILRQLPEITLLCAGMGTSGTMTGLGTYFKDSKPSVYRIGVCTAPGDRVPGPRSHALLAPVLFPWSSSIDHIEHVGSHESYSLSLSLCRQGLICGPSSGFNLQGLFQFLDKRKAEETLDQLRGENGEVHCVFLCCDLPYQYIGEYFDKLGAEHFPQIHNEELAKVDLYRYDDRWELPPLDAIHASFDVNPTLSLPITSRITPKSNIVTIDIRQELDFQDFHLPGSINVPFANEFTPCPFSDPSTLATLWTRLETYFAAPPETLLSAMDDKQILVVCYDGDASRVASSVLRAKGYETNSVKGGFMALRKVRAQSNETVSTEGKVDEIIMTPIAQTV